MDLATRTYTAHADSWEAQARLRVPWGGAAVALRGIRVAACGVAHVYFNGADVVEADCDLAGARAFYAARGAEWAVRVPAGLPWSHGRRLLGLRLMALPRDQFVPAPAVPGLSLRLAGPDDLDAVVGLDEAAFGETAGPPWIAPLLTDDPAVEVALALLGEDPVSVAYTLRSDGLAGPCLYLAGVGVAPAARRRGIGAAVSAWLLERGLAGAEFAHLQADTEEAARVYRRLGFTDTPGIDVYVDL